MEQKQKMSEIGEIASDVAELVFTRVEEAGLAPSVGLQVLSGTIAAMAATLVPEKNTVTAMRALLHCIRTDMRQILATQGHDDPLELMTDAEFFATVNAEISGAHNGH